MKKSISFHIAKWLLAIPAFVAGAIGMFGTWISYPLFKLFNWSYKLPDDKAAIDVAPVTSQLWRLFAKYHTKYWWDPIQERYSCVHPPNARKLTYHGQKCTDCGCIVKLTRI